ncbi:MAG: DUF3179 domain-containing (seleno)protein [Halobacteriales archaeon]|nr:DUF3179 domain-containing (seleno)protein [Halobacteriales archaeon]
MTDAIEAHAEGLLVRDRAAHADAVAALAESGDERAIPYLFEVSVIDAIASDWGAFGFPEVLRERDPPRYLELPEVAWPGVIGALGTLAEPDFDDHHAWVQWESWYSQQSIEPPEGFADWKRRLFKSYLPPVGGLLDAEPMSVPLRELRWGNTDRSFLAALNAPPFVGADEAAAYLDDGHLVFGFEVDAQAYAVPRWILFPHEMANLELGGRPLALSYCTLCNAPILYDRTVDGRTLTFGNTGMLWRGNKVMYDEETESLWSQHRGDALAGEHLQADATLDVLPVTQADWADWRADHPETLVVDLDTGYDLDYRHYDGNIGFFEHYWTREDIVQPGVERAEGALAEKASVYGVTGAEPGSIRIYPVEAVGERGPFGDTIDGTDVVVLLDGTGDVAVYEAPPLPVEYDGDRLVDADGTAWTITRSALEADGARRERVPGRHGLWFAFRTQYPDATVVTGG